MKDYTSENLRNICLNGHMSSGKSTLVEAMLYQAKEIDRMGRTEDQNLTSDFTEEEKAHGHSLFSTVLPVEYHKLKVNVIDCPGSRDFIGDVKPSIRAADLMLLVLDAASGFEVGAEFAYDWGKEYDMPVAVFVNKMDKENANFDQCLAEVAEYTGLQPIPVTLPIGSHDKFSGVVDLLEMKAIYAEPGKPPRFEEIPADMADAAKAARAKLVEAAAEGDDTIMTKFLEEDKLTQEEIYTGLREIQQEHRFIPVIAGCAIRAIGVEALEEFLEHCAPNPLQSHPRKTTNMDGEEFMMPCETDKPFSALVFRTVYDPFLGKINYLKIKTGALNSDSVVHNATKDRDERIAHPLEFLGKKPIDLKTAYTGDVVAVAKLDHTGTNDTLCDPASKLIFPPTSLPKPVVSKAIEVANKADEEKLGMAIGKVADTDPSCEILRDPETHETVIRGMGELHIDIVAERLKHIANVEFDLVKPKVPYRETLTKRAEGEYQHKKQSGGRGQYGKVHLRIEPTEPDAEFEFLWEVVGGNIPTNFQGSVEKGIRAAMDTGVISGNKVVGFNVACFDGKHHPVDSSDMAFQIAATMGFKQIAQGAAPTLLEPIMNVRVIVPDDHLGDVMGLISGKRGHPMGSEVKGNRAIVTAHVPLAEMFDFSREMRSMTQGRGIFESDFDHYARVSPDIQKQIVEQYEAQKAEGH